MKQGALELTVLVPTYGREASLERLLRSLDATDPADALIRVLVVDNALDLDGSAVTGGRRFPTQVIPCARRGKSHALNEGLRHVPGQAVVFLDDDVSVDRSYFREVCEGLVRWPDAGGFGGRIELAWPEGSRLPHPRVCEYVRGFAYAAHDFLEKEGPYPEGTGPCGPNMVFRRQWLTEDAFDPATGPGEGRYRMGSEEALIRLVRAAGGCLVHLPKLLVQHHIRPEQLGTAWILRRAHSYGRSLNHHRMSHFGVSGTAPTARLVVQWMARLTREIAFALAAKDYPRMWARIDRKLIEGILAERAAARSTNQGGV